jgi:sugar fermentation stimulation protein A
VKPFPAPLLDAVLIRRYKRFLADVRFADGRVATVHCPNPGRMTGLDAPQSRILLSDSGDPRRKLRYTWELAQVARTWVCVNTQVANRVVAHWLESKQLLSNHETVRREPRHNRQRFDFALGEDTLVEVKTVTLAQNGVGAFPDAKTERGTRHVNALADLRRKRRVLLFFVARGDVNAVRPADEIDPAYGKALRRAKAAGVEVHAVQARFGRHGVRKGPMLDVVL